MNDRTTGIGADTQVSIGRFRYPLILASIGRYLIPDTGNGLTLKIGNDLWLQMLSAAMLPKMVDI